MPNAVVSDIITAARDFLDEPNPTGRFSDAMMTRLVERASKYVNRDIMWPQARYIFGAIANQQEYTLDPAPLRVDRVYIDGVPIVPTDSSTGVGTLEGNQYSFYDNTAQTAPAAGSGGPPGTVGPYSPQWVAQLPQTYPGGPFGNGSGFYAPTSLPFHPGQRQMYYRRSGTIGFVPAPASAGSNNIVIEGILVVPALTSTAQSTLYPDAFISALAWKVCEFAKFSDDGPNAAEARNYAASQYNAEMRQWRDWEHNSNSDAPGTIFVRTGRSAYITGNRRGFGSGGYIE